MTYDPGMDPPPEQWVSPEYDPGFAAVDPGPELAENVDNPGGPVRFIDGDEQHRETLDAIRAQSVGLARIVSILSSAGMEIVTLTPAQVASQRIRFRVQYIIIARATAGAAILGIGSGTYNFTAAAVPARVDFPLVIERGVDMLYTGDGFMYLVGWPE